MASGRTFVGRIDSQTDAAVLWLRMGDGPIVLRRPVEWNCVVRLLQGHNEHSPQEVQRLAEAAKHSMPKPLPTAATRSCTRLDDSKDVVRLAAIGCRIAEQQPTVASFRIDAEVSHWTPTVETAASRCACNRTSADGTLVPADGTLTVDLIAQRPLSQGHRLQRWFD